MAPKAMALSPQQELAAMTMQLLTMARDNKWKELETVASMGMPVTLANQMGQTALHIAALWGHSESIEVLVKAGQDVNVRNSRGSTPLHFAASAKANARKVCETLLKLGADASTMDMMGRQPYELAEADDVRALLGGPDPRVFHLAENGQAAELRKLLTEEAIESVCVLDAGGRTPLNLAVLSGSLDTVKVLLEFDPKCLSAPDAAGDTALHSCMEEQPTKYDILEWLLSLKPAILNAQNMNSSEYSSGNWLLKGEVVEPLDKTALLVAVEQGDTKAAKLLIDAGADLNLVDYDKRAPLHIALEEGDEAMVELLLASGADPNAPSQDFISCVHYAATRGPITLLEQLLAKGGNVNTVSEEGWSPLALAARSGKEDRAARLIQAGANCNAVNSQGCTPLLLAAVNGHSKVVDLLLRHGADKSIPNKEGKTPAEVAKTPEIKSAIECFTG